MRRSAVACAAACAIFGASEVRAEAELDVSGAVLSIAPRLEVRVEVTNRGDRAAAPLTIAGELLGQERETRLAAGIAPGGRGSAVLDFEPAGARLGVHVLTLLLEFPVAGPPDGAGNPPLASHRAWLMVALGEPTSPPVSLSAKPARIDVAGGLEVEVGSTDAARHRIRLRALTPRGLRPDAGIELDVPARGVLPARLPIMRAGAQRGTRHAVLLVAETQDERLARATVATATVEVAADRSLLPRLRPAVLALGLLLIVAALAVEVWPLSRGSVHAVKRRPTT